jgi:hypothetical protein
MQRSSDFERQVARSRDTAEIPIKEWFKAQGKFVVPQYAFTGKRGDKAGHSGAVG